MDTTQLQQIVDSLRVVGTDSQSVEVKSGVGKSIRDTLSAFANSNGGLIIVGLSEENGFAPVDSFNASASRDALVSRSQELTPTLLPHIEMVPFEGITLVVAEISPLPANQKPCYVTAKGRYGGSYQRLGDADVVLQKYEVERLLEERSQPLWDEEPILDASVDDFDSQILADFLEIQKRRRPKTFLEGEKVALERLRLTREGHPTLAALLTLGSYPQEFFPRLNLTFTVFPGTSKGDITRGIRMLDSRPVEGPIPEIVETTVDLVQANMRQATSFQGAQRSDIPDYPLIAVREAVVNALLHRDYSPQARGTQVQVNMFADRLEVLNPGGLYGAVTVQNIGKAGISSARNQRLVTFLEDARLPTGGAVAEGRGTGIAVIRTALEQNYMPQPEIDNTLSSFRITFRKPTLDMLTPRATAPGLIMQFLQDRETVSTTELVKESGFSRSAIQKALNELIAAGQVAPLYDGPHPRQRYRKQ